MTTRFGIDYVRIRQGGPDHRRAGAARPRSAAPELPDGLEILSGIRAGDQLVQP